MGQPFPIQPQPRQPCGQGDVFAQRQKGDQPCRLKHEAQRIGRGKGRAVAHGPRRNRPARKDQPFPRHACTGNGRRNKAKDRAFPRARGTVQNDDLPRFKVQRLDHDGEIRAETATEVAHMQHPAPHHRAPGPAGP